MQLRDIWIELASNYLADFEMIDELWGEIEKEYSYKSRYYHNLSHLTDMISQLMIIKANIKDFNTILFATFYHDIVYKTNRNDNEEKSAELARNRLQKLRVPGTIIDKCCKQIIATKNHSTNEDIDTNYLVDTDLGILGAEWPEYKSYADKIRNEYGKYPDSLYKKGRRDKLNHFLRMDRIFKTDEFKERFEKQARDNMEKELKEL